MVNRQTSAKPQARSQAVHDSENQRSRAIPVANVMASVIAGARSGTDHEAFAALVISPLLTLTQARQREYAA